MPSYLLSAQIGPQWFALGFRLLAGFGAFAEAGFDVFVGTESTLHPSVSIEGGLFLDYEVLP